MKASCETPGFLLCGSATRKSTAEKYSRGSSGQERTTGMMLFDQEMM